MSRGPSVCLSVSAATFLHFYGGGYGGVRTAIEATATAAVAAPEKNTYV